MRKTNQSPPTPQEIADKISALAEREIVAVRKALADLFDLCTPITIELFQPLSIKPDPTPHGRFADVGPRPDARDQSIVFQAAGSGESGHFFKQRDVYIRTGPLSTKITARTIKNYIAANDEANVQAQTALEHSRYKNALPKWNPSRKVLPVGAHIHQVGLIPTRLPKRSGGRFPILGLVYSINHWDGDQLSRIDVDRDTTADEEHYWRLILEALAAADRAVSCRLDLLLYGGETAPTPDSEGDFIRLVGKLLFAHHWFYPYDPIVHTLITKLLPASDLAEPVFIEHGSLPPVSTVALSQSLSKNVDELFTQVCEDITQLVTYASVSFKWTDYTRPMAVESAVASVLSLLVGDLVLVDDKGRTTPVNSTTTIPRHSETYYTLRLSNLNAGNYTFIMPMFSARRLAKQLDRGLQNPAAIDDVVSCLMLGHTHAVNLAKNTLKPSKLATRCLPDSLMDSKATKDSPSMHWFFQYARRRINAHVRRLRSQRTLEHK